MDLSSCQSVKNACHRPQKRSGSQWGLNNESKRLQASGGPSFTLELVLAAAAPAAAPAAAAADKLPRALTPIRRQPPLNEQVAINCNLHI